MSKDVDRSQVFKTTRVRTALKNDGSWIHQSKQEKEEQDKSWIDSSQMESPVRQKSFVLSTAKIFGSVDSPLSPPVHKPHSSLSEGISANQANGEVIPPQKDVEPDGSTVQMTDDTKHQAPSEELITAKKNPKAVFPVEPVEQPVATTENNADTIAAQPNVDHTEAKASADTHMLETFADPPEVPAILAVKLQPQEKLLVKTEPADATHLEDAGVESTVQPPKGSCNGSPPEHAAKEIFENVTVVVVESSPDISDVMHATPGEEAAIQNSAEPVPDLLIESVSNSHTQCAAETATEGSCERCTTEQSTEEMIEAVAETEVESSPETLVVNNATRADKDTPQDTVEPILDIVSELPSQSAAEESEVVPAPPPEPVVQTSAEEVVECEVQPVNNTVIEQSAEPAPENTADCFVELRIEDALESAATSEAGVCQGELSDRAIELTDAVDAEPTIAEIVPKPVEDPKQSHSEDSKLNQSDNTENDKMSQMPRMEVRSTHTLRETRDGKAVCSFCDQIIDANVKIKLSEPLVTCHVECLKCGACAKDLGDLLTPMFLHDQMIHCDGCFAKALTA